MVDKILKPIKIENSKQLMRSLHRDCVVILCAFQKTRINHCGSIIMTRQSQLRYSDEL